MPAYRLYLIDPQGHIRQAFDLEANDDAQAISQAERQSAGAPAELWQGKRKVKTFHLSR